MKSKLLALYLVTASLFGGGRAGLAQPQQTRVAPRSDSDQTQVQELVFTGADLPSTAAGVTTSTLIPTNISAVSGCTVAQVKKSVLTVRLDFGEVYNLGSSVGQRRFQVLVEGVSTAGGTLQLPAPLNAAFQLQVDGGHPAQALSADLTTVMNVASIRITVSSPVGVGTRPPSLRLVAQLAQDIALTPPATAGAPIAPVGTGFERLFSWTPACAYIGTYQVQIIKLYAGIPLDETLWAQQCTLLEKVLSPAERLDLQTGTAAVVNFTSTLAEGFGDYTWRVRAIGKPEIQNVVHRALSRMRMECSASRPDRSWI